MSAPLFASFRRYQGETVHWRLHRRVVPDGTARPGLTVADAQGCRVVDAAPEVVDRVASRAVHGNRAALPSPADIVGCDKPVSWDAVNVFHPSGRSASSWDGVVPLCWREVGSLDETGGASFEAAPAPVGRLLARAWARRAPRRPTGHRPTRREGYALALTDVAAVLTFATRDAAGRFTELGVEVALTRQDEITLTHQVAEVARRKVVIGPRTARVHDIALARALRRLDRIDRLGPAAFRYAA